VTVLVSSFKPKSPSLRVSSILTITKNIFANVIQASCYFEFLNEEERMKYFHSTDVFKTECGDDLQGLTIAYHTYGTLNTEKNNVVWVCHALTSNSAVVEWWPGVVGENTVIDPSKYFIVCANILGSCYGSSGLLL
jgi:homoserine acetyltransferase